MSTSASDPPAGSPSANPQTENPQTEPSSTAPRRITSVAVFCGSSDSASTEHIQLGTDVGRRLAEEGIRVVYGGGHSGLMGSTARGAMEAGGEVTGVVPGGLFSNEIPSDDISHLHVVPDMHARKALMYSLSDAFLALPGGLGTLEEVFEAATWTQLGLHDGGDKTVVLLATDGFWDGVVDFLDNATATRFIRPTNRAILRHASTIDDALAALRDDPSREAPPYVRT